MRIFHGRQSKTFIAVSQPEIPQPLGFGFGLQPFKNFGLTVCVLPAITFGDFGGIFFFDGHDIVADHRCHAIEQIAVLCAHSKAQIHKAVVHSVSSLILHRVAVIATHVHRMSLSQQTFFLYLAILGSEIAKTRTFRANHHETCAKIVFGSGNGRHPLCAQHLTVCSTTAPSPKLITTIGARLRSVRPASAISYAGIQPQTK